VLEFRQARVLGPGRQLPGQLGDDRLEQLGVEHADRFREAAGAEPLDAQRLGHLRQAHRLLQVVDGFDQRVPGVQQDQLHVAVEKQLAVAGPVLAAARVVQAVQQREHPLKVAQAEDVLFRERRFVLLHSGTGCHESLPGAISIYCYLRERRAERD
jgi:hypothetical protein